MYHLSVEVFGNGENPRDPSHWAFVIHQPPSASGDLLHVRVLDPTKGFFQFESRYGSRIRTQQALGLGYIALLTPEQRRTVIEIISKEEAPKNDNRNCQDWVFSALLSLEIEELVPPGSSEFWKGMINKPAREVAAALGGNWTKLVDLRSA